MPNDTIGFAFCRWGGYLDNTVAGGIPHGLSPTEALIKECDEEASLPEDFVRRHLKSVGSVSYFFQCVGLSLSALVFLMNDGIL